MRQVVRVANQKAFTGRSKSALYRDIEAGLVPRQIKLGNRAAGWFADELEAIVSARAAGKSDDDIRALVRRLEADRVRGAG